jgi:sugar/nucleoside kinase (ribokinase family)
MIGVGGIGTGLFFALEGDHTLGRNESRPARLLNVRDYGKLHIISHYVAVLLGAGREGSRFEVIPVAKVGSDEPGQRMLAEMAAAGIDTSHVEIVGNQPTLLSVCFQYPDGSGGNITTNESAASALSCEDVERNLASLAIDSRCIVLSAPEAPFATRCLLLKLAGDAGAFRVASFPSAEMDSAREARAFSSIDLLAMNEDEGSALTGTGFDPANPQRFLDLCAETLLPFQPELRIILSAGKHGAFAFNKGNWHFRPAVDVPVVSTAGAGDALLAGTLAALASGIPFVREKSAFAGSLRPDFPFEDAFDLGVLLAAYSITSPHTIHPGANLESLFAFAGRSG